MPITSIGSYEPTTAAFEDNWEAANSELTPGAITLAGNYTRTNFETDRTVLLTFINRVPALASDARFAAAQRDSVRAHLIERAKQLRGAVLSKVTDPAYLTHLPAAPKSGADLSKFCDPLHTMTAMWQRINAHASELGLSGPLTLQGGYAVAAFDGDIEALMSLTNAASRDENGVGFARSQRDTLMAAIYERMKQYRAAVPANLPADSPALKNLPKLSPPPGTTPPGLKVTGAWDAATAQANLSWVPSPAKDILKIQLRGCVGASYKNAEEEVIADLAPAATGWSGDWGLTAPGALATFKAYVMTTTGNENGGKAVKIVRPEIE